MARNRRLRGDIPRAFASHRGGQATRYRRFYAALDLELGPFARGSLLEHQAGRVAALWCEYSAATEALSEARRLRDAGRGRRPSGARLDRLSHRMLMASTAFSEALETLRAAAPPKSYHETLAIRKAQQEAAQARQARVATCRTADASSDTPVVATARGTEETSS